MAKIDKITQILFGVIDELNQLRPVDDHLVKDLDAPLAGDHGRLDSAGLINLIVLVEEKSVVDLGEPIILTDDDTLSRVSEIFNNLGSLAQYIDTLMSANHVG